jgi:hypothetical protein
LLCDGSLALAAAVVQVHKLFRPGEIADDVEFADGFFFGNFTRQVRVEKSLPSAQIKTAVIDSWSEMPDRGLQPVKAVSGIARNFSRRPQVSNGTCGCE